MKKISSGRTFLLKKVFPAFWFGILALVVVTMLTSGVLMKEPFVIVLPCVMTVFGYFLFKKIIWDLADEVFDCGDFLLVRKGREEESVMLSNVMNVSATTFVNPPRITLRLVQPGKFGDEIAFSPAVGFRLNPFARIEVADDLMVRVDQARVRRAR